MYNYTLPKIWAARVQKYWDKIIPSDYPESSSEFNVNLKDEDKPAVEKMEDELGTEDSAINAFVEEGNYVSNYYGTWDVEGEAGELTLLSPEKIETDGSIIAAHLNGDTWEQIEDAHLDSDGYAWGTLESFSPIAIFAVKKDIETAVPDFMGGNTWIVANGNPVKVFTEDGVVKVMNMSSGTVLELGDATVVCGGSIDGTKVDSTNVSVIGVENENFNVYAGSYCWNNEDDTITTTNDTIVVNIMDSKIRAVTGAGGRTRVNNLKINVNNSSIKSHIGCGETWNTKAKKDANTSGENLGMSSVAWCKNVEIMFENGSYCELVFTGGNTGYSYTDNSKITVKDSKIDYLVGGGSNGRTRHTEMVVSGLEGNIFQTVNRGLVDEAVASINDSTIPNLFVFGDATDKTVTGVVNSINIDINKGTYGVKLGVQGGAAVTDVSPVKAVKISRSADYSISDEDKALLGDKFIVK